jgi:1,4-dihydroxy-2-naphthoate octaprenyltransferase
MQTRTLGGYVDTWLMAARPVTLSAAAVPVLVGTALAAETGTINWTLFALAFIGAVLIQVGTNLADEYIDHRRSGGAVKYLAPHKVIERGLLSEQSVLVGTAVSFGLSVGIGLYIVSQVGWPILVVGVLSMMAGYLHSSGPFPLGSWALGELTVFIFMGPLIVMASYYVQLQEVTWATFWASVPVALLVTAILQANNLRDVEEDRREGKYTLVTVFGSAAGRWTYAALLLGVYLALLVNAVTGVVPWLALVSLASLPWALLLVRRLWAAETRLAFNGALVGTARLHLYAGGLTALGITLHTMLND